MKLRTISFVACGCRALDSISSRNLKYSAFVKVTAFFRLELPPNLIFIVVKLVIAKPGHSIFHLVTRLGISAIILIKDADS